MKVNIDVRKEHILHGKVNESSCMVANALRDVLRDGVNIGVGITVASVHRTTYRLPSHVAAKIETFCNYQDSVPFGMNPVQPFSFTMDLPAEIIRESHRPAPAVRPSILQRLRNRLLPAPEPTAPEMLEIDKLIERTEEEMVREEAV